MPNYTYGNKFRFSINTFPILGERLELNVISTPVPGIALGSIDRPTPYKTLPVVGDSLTIDDLNVTFILSEDLLEWKYLFKWMSLLKECAAKDINNYVVDAAMNMLTNKSNSLFSIGYESVYPVNLSSIDFTDQITSADTLTMTATFKIKNINIKDPNDPKIDELKIVT